MAIVVQHGYFDEDQQALEDIEKDGYYGTKIDIAPSGDTPVHWHDVSMHIYITEGTLRIKDTATGEVHEGVSGTRFDIPERALHIEEEHHGYSAIAGLSKSEVPEPLVRLPEEL
ncbi:hypothetical protein OAL49_05355 [Gammaproteobacteria bacterium]|nr:hypothetical protein [Gammaproteobacteria bacterium]